jgi:hypothetical protein
METAFAFALLLDHAQTRDIKNHPGYQETNPLLGSHPSDTRIRNYFLAAGVAHLAVTHLLPPRHRHHWQGATLAIQAGYVAHNYRIGLRLDF